MRGFILGCVPWSQQTDGTGDLLQGHCLAEGTTQFCLWYENMPEPSATWLLPSGLKIESSQKASWLPVVSSSLGVAFQKQSKAPTGLISYILPCPPSQIIAVGRIPEVFAAWNLRTRIYLSQQADIKNTESASGQVFSERKEEEMRAFGKLSPLVPLALAGVPTPCRLVI